MTIDGRVRRALDGDESVLRTRVVTLDDIHIRASGTGRDVTAYATVWNTPAEVMDSDGHYMEQNAPDSMTRSAKEGLAKGRIFSVYNHAKTLSGTPSETHSVPIGKPIEIRPDAKGLLTVTRYNRDPAAEQVLEAIRSGSLTGMSYTGVFLQSDPPLGKYGQYRAQDGELTLVTRQEIALIEYGPTPRPAYQDAAILGVRNKKAAQVDDEQPEREVITVTTPSLANVTITGNTFTGTDLTLTRTETAQEAEPPGTTESEPPPAEAEPVVEAAAEAPSERLDTTTADAAIAHEGSDRARVDTSAWDAGAAMGACDTGAEYSAICAGRKSGPADERGSWALPHHKSPGAPPNAAAVRNALARLSQTDGLTNQAAARKHLEAHMSAVSSTSSSGRDPAPDAHRTEPHQHSAATHTTRSNPVDPTERTTMTIEERVARQSEVRARLDEIDSEYAGAELTAEARAEWSDLQHELVANERAIQDASQRAEYLRQVRDLNPSAGEQIDNERAGYSLPPLPNRLGNSGPAFHRQENIYDLQAIRNRARSIDELPVLYREYAMRAVEQSRFPSASGRAGAPNKEDVQGRVAHLLETIDDEQGSLARRVLTTGSQLYDRAFGKMLARQSLHGLTAEESRALQLGTDTAGGFAVPFQLDPTVILTHSGVVNPLRSISRVETITGKEWDGLTTLGVTVARGTESAEVGTADPAFLQPTVRTSRVMGWIPFSIELDLSWNAMRSQMTYLLSDAKDVEEATAFCTGNGTAPNPSGVVATLGTASYVTSGGSAVIQTGDVYLLENAMAPRFRQNSSILASKTIFNKFRAAYQGAAAFAGDPFVRPSVGTPGTLNGYPMHELSTMKTTAGTADLVMLQGDFSQFLIVDRVGMGIELVPQLLGSNRRPTGERGVFALWFNNSKILTDQAFRLLQIKAT